MGRPDDALRGYNEASRKSVAMQHTLSANKADPKDAKTLISERFLPEAVFFRRRAKIAEHSNGLRN